MAECRFCDCTEPEFNYGGLTIVGHDLWCSSWPDDWPIGERMPAGRQNIRSVTRGAKAPTVQPKIMMENENDG